MRSGQAWSMDLVVGVLIFLIVVGIIYSLLSNNDSNDSSLLRLESEVVATKMTTDPSWKVADDNTLSMTSLVTLAKYAEENYTELKSELGVKNEFCIYLVDEKGNLAYIQDDDAVFTGIGSGDAMVNISGVECGKRKVP